MQSSQYPIPCPKCGSKPDVFLSNSDRTDKGPSLAFPSRVYVRCDCLPVDGSEGLYVLGFRGPWQAAWGELTKRAVPLRCPAEDLPRDLVQIHSNLLDGDGACRVPVHNSKTMNPKERAAQSEGRPRYSAIPLDTILEGDARAHELGANKYGRLNWRKDKVKQTTYLDAMVSHMRKYAAGHETDEESGVSHLYHIRACCAILLDAEQHGTLIQDLQEYESK